LPKEVDDAEWKDLLVGLLFFVVGFAGPNFDFVVGVRERDWLFATTLHGNGWNSSKSMSGYQGVIHSARLGIFVAALISAWWVALLTSRVE